GSAHTKAGARSLSAPAPGPAGPAPGEVRPDLVAVRRRGAGTDLAPNA
ncbi:biotin synthase BioB, partial [Streptomyces sp. NPDC097619]